jgi:hypothetical protein
MIYLASPYSHSDPAVVQARVEAAGTCTVNLMVQGYIIFSPIIHCHDIATRLSLPTDHEFWRRYDISMLRLADAMFILDIDGWQESKGLKEEIVFANSAHIPVSFVNQEGLFTQHLGDGT